MLLLIILAGLSGWAYRGHILNILSPKEKVSVPIRDVKEKDSVSMLKLKEKVSVPIRKRQATTLFLDEQVSLAGLFRLFKEKAGRNNYASDNVHVGLFSFHTKIDNYPLFKKPFRVLLAHPGPSQSPSPYPAGKASDPVSSSRYLLINQVTADGAIVVDAAGKDRSVTRGFLQTHWGQEVSWVYPYKNRSFELVMGMSGPGVSKVQGTLKKIGYPVKTTGIYDDSTFRTVMKFQKNLGLMPDGIAGLRTKALLYQMLDE
jgi:hypothetical protein